MESPQCCDFVDQRGGFTSHLLAGELPCRRGAAGGGAPAPSRAERAPRADHVGSAYSKLDITSRAELSAALALPGE